MDTPCSSRRTAAGLNSFVKILLDNSRTQFSFEWILSLNWLCQKWGQVRQTSLGLLYQDAKGVKQDYVEAYKWLTLASAKERKAALLKDRLARKMTPYQIDEAERLAGDWMPAEPGLFAPRPRVMTMPSFKLL